MKKAGEDACTTSSFAYFVVDLFVVFVIIRVIRGGEPIAGLLRNRLPYQKRQVFRGSARRLSRYAPTALQIGSGD
jgi:hypothetical protein